MAVAAGLERPTRGEARLLGQDLARLSEDGRARLRRGRLAIVFQAFHLLPNMTAEENISTPLEIAGEANADRTAMAWLDRVGLAARPQLLFADEPTGNLDAANAAAIADLIFSLTAEIGAAMVMVTHDPALAARADRVARMFDGVMVAGS
jgi:putative ABC transport system ATP-binding protein